MFKQFCCFGKKDNNNKYGPFGGMYFLGFVGAAIYYIQAADTFGQGLLGFLKAIIWPVFLVYKLLGL